MRWGFHNNARQSLGVRRAVPGAVRTGARHLYGAASPPSCHPLKGGGMTGENASYRAVSRHPNREMIAS